jgi:asparagine synthase (glutamine-hydrolysing)
VALPDSTCARGKRACPAVRAMCDRIRHSGPDDEGYHVEGGCAIGMRRLSIIDLSTGHQPMANEDESVWVVFNGEIYNYRELRRDLLARGTGSPRIATPKRSYISMKNKAPRACSACAACSLMPSGTPAGGVFFLARDRFGKKPLYYAVLPEGLYFGSELKCLLRGRRAVGDRRGGPAALLSVHVHP